MKRKQVERIDLKDRTGDISLNVPSPSGDPWEEEIREKEYDDSTEHPTPEQLMIRQAAQYLTSKQKKVWELWNYDKLTQDEIAAKLGVRQQAIQQAIKGIERKIAKWVKSNLGAYKLLKGDLK